MVEMVKGQSERKGEWKEERVGRGFEATTWHRWPVYRFTIHEEVTVERRDRYLNERYRPLSRRHEQGRWINRGKCETIQRRTV